MHYGFIKDASGTSRLIEMEDNEPAEDVTLIQPTTATLEGDGAPRYQCLVEGCGKPFRSSGIAAIHFKNAHPDLATEKNAWRTHIKGASKA